MARIAGVDIPNNKRIEIALTYIYGIGKKYQGGIFHTTVVINGRSKDVRTVKDPNGNPTSVIITDKILGIF